MKKTISIHIQGYPFIIEEVAFAQLENYIARLQNALKGQQGAHEIVQDIELRIAELLLAKTSKGTQVLNENDVTDVLSTLGDPSDYTEETEGTNQEEDIKEPFYQQDLREKRLFRDTENRYIGGVCSGLGSYFGIDATIIRIIWALFFFVGGMGLILYIILWILLPQANSTIDRLKMKGQPINVDSVKEEFTRAASSVSDKSKQFAQSVASNTHVKSGANFLVRIIKIGFGVMALFFALIALITLCTFIFGEPQFISASTNLGYLSTNSFADLIFKDGADKYLAWTAVYICSITFIVFCSLVGIVLLFDIKNKWYRVVNAVLILLFITGTVIGTVTGMRVAREFSEYGEVTSYLPKVDEETLIVNIEPSKQKIGKFTVESKPKWNLFIGENKITHHGVRMRYTVSKDSLFEISIKQTARSHKIYDASTKAANIQYNYKLDGNQLSLPTIYTFPKKDKLRDQEIYINIAIPKGKVVKIGNETIDLQKPIFEDWDEGEMYLQEIQSGRIRANGTYSHH